MAVTTYDNLIQFVRSNGERVSPRGHPTVEAANLSVAFSPGQFVKRSGMNLRLAFVEAMMLVGGFFDLDLIKAVAPNANHALFEKQSDYGARVRDQVPLVIEELKRDRMSRRAVIQYNGNLHTGTDDIACTLTSQYLIRQFAFRSTYTMRSWDLVLGFPNDIIMFGMLSKAIQRAIGIDEFEPSLLRVNAMSAHIYEETSGKAISGSHNTFCFELDEDAWPHDWEGIRDTARRVAYRHYIWEQAWPTDYIVVNNIAPHFLVIA